MAFESKYTGKQVEELLGKISTIPTKTSQLENDSDYINSERLPCFLDNYAPKDFSNLPIDNITLYWDNGVIKAKVGNGESGGGGGGGSTDCECLWELKQDAQGRAYIYSRLPVATQYGITMYTDVGNVNLPSLYDGLPIDNSTIYWEETLDDNGNTIKVLKAKGGIDIDGTLDDYIFNYLTNNNYAQKSDLPNMSLYVTNDIFNNTIDSLDFVDFNTYETINAIKNFKEGIEINGLGIYNIKDDIIYINSNVAIKGGLTTYADDGNIDLPSLYAGIPVDEITITKREDGTLMLNPNLELGGLDEEALQKYLDDYNYAKLSDIPSLDGYAKITYVDSRINNLINGAPAAYDTLKEIADVLQGNVNSIGDIITTLGTKADKTELAKYIPIAGDTEVTGIKDFLNGLKVGGLPISKYEGYDDVIYIDANVVLRGGLTQYAVDPVTIPSIIESLPQAGYESKGVASFSDKYFVIDTNGKVSIIPDSVGLNEEKLTAWLANSDYTTKTYVDDTFATKSSLNATNAEVAKKWTQDNDKITNWDTAYGWGNHASAGYFLANNFTKNNIVTKLGISDWALAATKPSYTTKEVTEDTNLYFTNQRATDALADTLKAYVTLKGTQTIEGEKDFTGGLKVNGSPIVYDSENGYWLLQGNLLITGGLTQYVDDGSVNLPNLYDGLPIDRDTIYWDNGLLKAKVAEGGITSITKDMVIEALGYTPYDATNPNGYITSAALNGYATQTWVNQQGFLTEHQDLSGYQTKITSTNKLAYSLISGTPDLSVYLTTSSASSTYQPKITSSAKLSASLVSGLATVATSGSYNDLSNKPTIPTSLKNPYALSWSGYSSGSYDGSAAKSITIPSNTNQLTNGAGFITLASTAKTGSIDSGDIYTWCAANQTYFGSFYQTEESRWYNILSIRHRNGGSDGNLYGMVLLTSLTGDDNLRWKQHIGGAWGTIKTILDSSNYSSYALPLSGGTISSSNYATQLRINRTDAAGASVVRFSNSIDGIVGDIGIGGSASGVGVNPLFQDKNGNVYILWHSGNDGSGTGLDADLLDGVQLSGLFTGLSSSADTNLSITIGGVTKSIASLYSKCAMSFYTPWNNPTSGSYDLNSHLLGMARCYGSGGTLLNAPSSFRYGSILCLSTGTAALSGQLAWNINHASTTDTTKALYWRAADNPNGYTYAKWHQIAFTDSNVASATKLQTARKIWGQDFDGTGDVNGVVTDTGSSRDVGLICQGSSYKLGFIIGSGNTNRGIYDHTNESWMIYRDTSTNVLIPQGNVGIGTTSPLSKLHVAGAATIGIESSTTPYSSINFRNTGTDMWQISARFNKNVSANNDVMDFYYYNGSTWKVTMALYTTGNLLVAGGITQYSDIRKKTKLQDVELTLKQIANAPLIEHYYNSDDKKTTHVGSIAQYWAEMNDWFCKLDSDGYYTMEIQNAALASAISVARELERYESKTDKKIRMLKKRINELEDEIEKLKSA